MIDRRSGNRLREFTEYCLIIAMYYVTGGAFSYSYYSAQITVFFLAGGWIALVYGAFRRLLGKKAFAALLSMSCLILLVPVLNNDGFSSYIAIVMQLFIGFMIAGVIRPDEFCRKYVAVMVFFAAVSLLGFAAGAVYPSIATFFPRIIGDASVDYYNAGVYVFMQPKGYASFRLMTRNAGICWEPGCYQCFVNIALLFLLEEKRKGTARRFTLKFAILVTTVFTTFSTTGMIILCLLLAVYVKTWRGKSRVASVMVPVLGAALAVYVLAATTPGQRIVQKIVSEILNPGSEGQNLFTRTSLGHIRYLFEDGFWFFGMSFPRLLSFGAKGLWNSVIHSILCLGIPFTLIQMTGYWKGSRALSSRGGLLFVIMLMCASTETLFWRVFFNAIAAYGWMYAPCRQRGKNALMTPGADGNAAYEMREDTR